MDKQKIREMFEREGYKEISEKEYQDKDMDTSPEAIEVWFDTNPIKTLYFAPKNQTKSEEQRE